MISRAVAFVRTLLALIFWIIFIPPAALIAFPWTLITGNIDFLYWLGMRLAFAAPRVAGVKVKLVGLDKIDNGFSNVTLTGPAEFVFEGTIEI